MDQLLQPGYHPRQPQGQQQQPQKPLSSNPHLPWTHAPICTHSHSLNSLSTKYCVYTSQTAFINGISILTTPSLAALAAEHLDEEPLSIFFTPDQFDEWSSQPRPWEIVDIPGKDKGVVATRKIRKYETFMVDQAAVMVDLEMEKGVGLKEGMRLLKVAVDRLKRPEVVREMSGRHAGALKEGEVAVEGRVEEDVMMTNAFGTSLGEGSFRGLFPLVSRINHACDPNSFVMFSNSGFSLGIKAYRDIDPGEEITISYLLLGKTHSERQQGLSRWGFTCTCALCSLPTPERNASDARRARITRLQAHLESQFKSHAYNAALRTGEEIVSLMKEENLTALLADQYVVMTRLSTAAGDREAAEMWAGEAVEVLGEMGFLGTEWREEGRWGVEELLGAFGGRGVYE
ncbi:SET domain-containing protein [Westerdykella ornata]|uniref:SET domain-containing protein n=1 Tax=Westerdykella ornata TaxID=318751 RepID=A0A6A6J9Q7_WESOR|nr:SET domain-containing protein [Westerdykella ornata]KAF2273065.1 SET domain-containing protein [Westerdykella ornata]